MMHSVLLLALLFCANLCAAHELRPAYLELRQSGPETFHVLWKVPAGDNEGIRFQLPENCTPVSETIRLKTPATTTERFTVSCPGGLDGRRISVEGPAAKLFDVLVRIVRPDGSARVVRLGPNNTSFVVERAPGRWQMIATYLLFGIAHIARGVDHLLFVL